MAPSTSWGVYSGGVKVDSSRRVSLNSSCCRRIHRRVRGPPCCKGPVDSIFVLAKFGFALGSACHCVDKALPAAFHVNQPWLCLVVSSDVVALGKAFAEAMPVKHLHRDLQAPG